MEQIANDLTHAQIAARAEKLYLDSGCVPGRDEQNWILAEAQLKQEKGFQPGTGDRPKQPKQKKGESKGSRRNGYAVAA